MHLSSPLAAKPFCNCTQFSFFLHDQEIIFIVLSIHFFHNLKRKKKKKRKDDKSCLLLELNNATFFMSTGLTKRNKTISLTRVLVSDGPQSFHELLIDSDTGKTSANVKRIKTQKKGLRSMVYFEQSLVISLCLNSEFRFTGIP